MKKYYLLIFLLMFNLLALGKEYHVSKNGNDSNNGNVNTPFLTIAQAVINAFPGDTITVHQGTYREWINPLRGGESDTKRIVYRAAVNEKVAIKGSEIITGWEIVKDGIWKVTIPNSFFGNYNPYQDSIYGDWFYNHGRIHHTGEVFLNEKSLFEKENLENVFNPIADSAIIDIEGSTYTWYCESNEENTTIWANFHEFNPNKELVEISTRRTCFYPDQPGINYLTISGFDISQAATQWAAPTAEQVGMISTNWNKGWIIENNVIHNSKCSGITLGKERSTGHNVWSANPSLDGSLHYIEVVFRTLRNGWNKENIGSHVVRNNKIFDCEQTGMCGSMGAAFSLIENNHIFNIYTKRQFSGAEIGGIKFHAAIDTRIMKNRIHNSGRGVWLDWMAQGTRVSRNLMYKNDMEDVFMEVNHGPTLVDNNLLLSAVSLRTQSQGSAIVHNLIAGQLGMWAEYSRFTPYHLPHSTEIAGLSNIFSGDDRYYNNIFIGIGPKWDKTNTKVNYGTGIYNKAKLPVEIANNIYYDQAIGYENEINSKEIPNFNPNFKVIEEGDNVYLEFKIDDSLIEQKCMFINTEMLGKAKMPNQAFENPDGSALNIDLDYFGKHRGNSNPTIGPIENIKKGYNKLKIW